MFVVDYEHSINFRETGILPFKRRRFQLHIWLKNNPGTFVVFFFVCCFCFAILYLLRKFNWVEILSLSVKSSEHLFPSTWTWNFYVFVYEGTTGRRDRTYYRQKRTCEAPLSPCMTFRQSVRYYWSGFTVHYIETNIIGELNALAPKLSFKDVCLPNRLAKTTTLINKKLFW